MKRKLCALLSLTAMVLIGAMHWVDLSYYTNMTTGFVERGEAWMRYLVFLVPLAMGLLGIRLVGARAIGVLRLRHNALGVLVLVAGVAGFAYGTTLLVYTATGSKSSLALYYLILGLLLVWYGVWMVLAAFQLFLQRRPSPTRSAIAGILAALPFCQIAVFRVLANPSSMFRVDQLVRSLSALVAMLWLSMLLRAFYIALTRRRVRWMYLFGLFTFLLTTCLELPQTIHMLLFRPEAATPFMLFEALVLALLGLVAGVVSVLIVGQDEHKKIGVYYLQEA